MPTLPERKEQLKTLLHISAKQQRIQEIQDNMADPTFWRNHEKAGSLTQELERLQELIATWKKANSEEEISELERHALFTGEHDERNAIISLHAGAGGTEAQDWAEMLLRMFERYAQRKGYTYTVVEISQGEETGIKSATVLIRGHGAYGHVRSEAGVHRLVRISPFDADKARHTSFVLVEILPELASDQEIQVQEKDLRVDVYRSRGHGGQGVNTTDSAVRITHIPTGIVVAVQNERSQQQNRVTALRILQSRLQQIELKKQEAEKLRLRGEHIEAGWGNQIRSYVLHPYKQVKDHRTGYTSTNPDDVLSGNLDGFVDAYLRWRAGKTV